MFSSTGKYVSRFINLHSNCDLGAGWRQCDEGGERFPFKKLEIERREVGDRSAGRRANQKPFDLARSSRSRYIPSRRVYSLQHIKYNRGFPIALHR